MSILSYFIVILIIFLATIVRKKSREEMKNFWRKTKIWEKTVWILCLIGILITVPIVTDAIFKTDSFLLEISYMAMIMCLVISDRLHFKVMKRN